MKKLLTLTLSLLMAFSLCLTISADDDKTYADDTVAVFLKRHNEDTNAGDYDEVKYTKLQDAINAAKDGVMTTIILVKDTTESITIPKNKSIMLDLKGYTLTAENNKDAIFVEKEATLVLEGKGRYDEQGELKLGRVVATTSGYAAVFNNGTASLIYGVECVRDDSSKWYIIVNHGTMDIDGSTVKSTNQSDTSSAIENGYVNYTSSNNREGYNENTNLANPILTIDDTTVSTYGCNAVKNDDGGVLTIHGGEFKTINKDNGSVILNWNVATINGGTFTADNSLAVISDGAYDGSEVNKGQLTINGGTFNASSSGVVFAYGVGASAPEYGVVKINGGTFTGNTLNNISYKLEISGGTFSSDITKYLVEGYNAVKNGEGKYQVVKENEDVIVPVDETKATTPALEEKAYDEAKSAVEELNKDKTDDQKITFDSSTKVELKTEEITSTTTDKYTKDDETKVITEAKTVIDDTTNKEIKLMPLDITLNVINGNIETPITSLTNEITVTLYLNDKTLSAIKGNTPTVVRIHDGEYEALETTLKGNALSFKTNKFSTYVIAYAETKATPTKSYSSKDKNQDGVISCEEEMDSANWIWSTTKNACVYKVSNTGVR